MNFPERDWIKDYAGKGLLGPVSTLNCDALFLRHYWDLPKSIIKLDLDSLPRRGPAWNFSRVTDLGVARFIVNRAQFVCFPNVVTLRVGEFIISDSLATTGIEMFISSKASPRVMERLKQRPIKCPKLEVLVVNGTTYDSLSKFEAPNLREIRFTRETTSTEGSLENPFEGLLVLSEHAGKQRMHDLSPSSLFFKMTLTKQMLTSLLRIYPLAEHLTLTFRRNEPNWEFTRNALLGRAGLQNGPNAKFQGASQLSSSSILAWPNLKSIRFSLLWDESSEKDYAFWRKYAQSFIDERKKSGLRSVICVWKDGRMLGEEVEI
jgi:hypothetical protein